MTRRCWVTDLWDPETDPAQLRMREALALRPAITKPGQADSAGEAPATSASESAAPDAATRRERIADLVRRIENGDLSATSTLRELLLEK